MTDIRQGTDNSHAGGEQRKRRSEVGKIGPLGREAHAIVQRQVTA